MSELQRCRFKMKGAHYIIITSHIISISRVGMSPAHLIYHAKPYNICAGDCPLYRMSHPRYILAYLKRHINYMHFISTSTCSSHSFCKAHHKTINCYINHETISRPG
ncbi:hypothetical protein W5O_04831 [Candida albicans Ca6]|nr:hypothetical protein W5O_04831 [Candida albicans Ca6]